LPLEGIEIVEAIHSWTEDSADICVEGLNETVRLLHITDAHIPLLDDRDSLPEEVVEASEKHAANFGSSPLDTFRDVLTADDPASWDVIALTGDIVNLPSQAAIEAVSETLSDIETPVLYTSGNHDWHFPKMPNEGDLREKWWPALEPLHKGNPAYSRIEVSGLQFICVDDSDYQITDDQLSFVQRSLESGQPTVVLTHIPLSLPTLRGDTLERWSDPILIADPGWSLERRLRWGTKEDTPATLAFHRLLSTAENLVAILCGHIHFSHTDTISRTAVQYVTAPCFDSRSREVTFSPLE
jgi:3',5'-cyclic AMP phosphodiesterase CpdA